ncbi:hypothetical protein PDTK01_27610 [Phycicoccus sp. DTK01]|nr:hypothetical protein PDTK01_27610 [Phycicoccus sp. DTK01]
MKRDHQPVAFHLDPAGGPEWCSRAAGARPAGRAPGAAGEGWEVVTPPLRPDRCSGRGGWLVTPGRAVGVTTSCPRRGGRLVAPPAARPGGPDPGTGEEVGPEPRGMPTIILRRSRVRQGRTAGPT